MSSLWWFAFLLSYLTDQQRSSDKLPLHLTIHFSSWSRCSRELTFLWRLSYDFPFSRVFFGQILASPMNLAIYDLFPSHWSQKPRCFCYCKIWFLSLSVGNSRHHYLYEAHGWRQLLHHSVHSKHLKGIIHFWLFLSVQKTTKASVAEWNSMYLFQRLW